MSLGRATEFARIASTALTEPFLLVDFGCSGGINPIWRVFGDKLHAFGFDPNLAECARLRSQETSKHVEYLAAFVGSPGASPVISERKKLPWSRIPAHRFSYNHTQQLRSSIVKSLSSEEKTRLNMWQETTLADKANPLYPIKFLKERGIARVDFIKLDIDGADFEIIQLFREHFTEFHTLGLIVEVPFFGGPAAEDHTFHNVDRFMKAAGFELFDLTMRRYSTLYLPGRYTIGIPAETDQGRIYQGDALYFTDLAQDDWSHEAAQRSTDSLLKLAALFSMFNLPDCAAELLVKFRDRISTIFDCDQGLELLAEQIQDKEAKEFQTYEQYMAAFERDDPYFYGKARSIAALNSQTAGGEIAQVLSVRADSNRSSAPYDISERIIHNNAICNDADRLIIVTPEGQWAYAVELPLRRDQSNANGRAHLILEVLIRNGVLGIGILDEKGTDFDKHVMIEEVGKLIVLRLSTSMLSRTGSLVLRNCNQHGATTAEFSILDTVVEAR